MAAQESISEAALGRSSSMDARGVNETLTRSDSQHNSKGRRGQRSGNDLFVCFAPRTSLNLVSRPVLSPSREKGKEAGRRSRALSSSIFSKAVKKQGYEGEEPTSPKVTCIGQVRVKHKQGKTWESVMQDMDGLRKGKQRKLKTKTESGSPGRSCASPSTQPRSDPASGSKKESHSSACSSFGKDFSCFGLPCDSYGSLPSFREKKSCGAVFAKSLVLIQETEGKQRELKGNRADKQIEAQASKSSVQIEAQTATPSRKEREDAATNLPIVQEEPVVAEIPLEISISETHEEPILKVQEEPILEKVEEEEEEEDTFEAQPPPPNALLLMRHKVEHLKVNVPPPSVNIILKRSTSAPAQCRVKRRGKGDDDEPQTDLANGKNGQLEGDLENASGESMSSEDQPKRASQSSSQKSFLKRCKSVSTSLTRSSGMQTSAAVQHNGRGGKEKPEAASHGGKEKPEAVSQQESKKQNDDASQEAVCNEAPETEDKDAVPAFLNDASRKRSESEALKVSLDMVPETWLWQSCTIVRPPKDWEDGAGQERDKRPDRQGTEWLDAELEASLWKSCKVAKPLTDTEDTSQEQDTEWLDAEVEASLWRSCRAAGSSVDTEDDVGKIYKIEEETDFVEGKIKASLWRSFSVGSQRRQHETGCIELEQKNKGQNICLENEDHQQLQQETRCCDSSSELEVGSEEKEGEPEGEEIAMEGNAISEENEGDPLRESTAEESDVGREVELVVSEEIKGEEEGLMLAEEPSEQERILIQQDEEDLGGTTPPAPDTLLFLRYKLGALRISLDAAPDSILNDTENSLEGDQKAMLKAELLRMSHFHEMGKYTRLLKAGKEFTNPCTPVSLPTAFRLQRCKSEPVRLTT